MKTIIVVRQSFNNNNKITDVQYTSTHNIYFQLISDGKNSHYIQGDLERNRNIWITYYAEQNRQR